MTQLKNSVETALGQIQDPCDDIALLGDDAPVERHDIGKNHRIGKPVMGVEPRTDRMGDRVHAAEAFLERGGAHRGSSQHLLARLEVLAIDAGSRQVVGE
jgi:hypothetical protein